MNEYIYIYIGGVSLKNPTLTRFFAFHFILALIILFIVILHLLLLHETGTSYPLGLNRNYDKVGFHPYFRIKDIYGAVIVFIIFIFVSFQTSCIFIGVENFIPSNPIITQVHIQPECFFYLLILFCSQFQEKLVVLLLWLYQ
ncbi:unnamed protein product [Larinioides sclopetarius]|uniref:Cytochrome b n=1 Tax=Larinioides sclopetarius TaxID=280406 RepID=A0AAV1ZFX0_9ARAC